MKLKKLYHKWGVCFTLLLFINTGMTMEEQSLAAQFHDRGHNFEKISRYTTVLDKVNDLLNQGIQQHQILVITDWDNTINGPGAWSQKEYNGHYHFPDTKRMLSEEEVDHRLRDPSTLEVIDNILVRNIKTLVATARPPLRDLEVITRVKEEHNLNLLDIRHPDNQDTIHFDKIRGMIDEIVNNTDPEDLLEKTRHKIQIMEERSGVRIMNNHLFNEEIRIIDNHRVVCHGGYIFTGYKKGPVLCELLGFYDSDQDNHFRHIIIVDDCERALKSFVPVLNNFTKKNAKLHILHYPIK